jgi:glycolate oxidase iron-sulfur subunit
VRVLTRHGCEVLVPSGSGCCGALPLHLGLPDAARCLARQNIAAWESLVDGGLDAVIVNASGCGASVKDYGTLLAEDPAWAERGRRIASISRDITEVLSDLQLKYVEQVNGFPVALHLPCSLQHGQGIAMTPRRLLEEAGFNVRDATEAHLCCGSAGTYNVLQPDIADRLGEKKAQSLDESGGEAIATGNMGCLLHIARFSKTPVVHTVELLDWATGGKPPAGLPRVARS